MTSSPHKEALIGLNARKKKATPEAVGVKRKCFGNTAKKSTKKPRTVTEEWYCELCDEDKIEEMIRCMKCKTWIHAKCAGVGKGVKKYYCNACK